MKGSKIVNQRNGFEIRQEKLKCEHGLSIIYPIIFFKEMVFS